MGFLWGIGFRGLPSLAGGIVLVDFDELFWDMGGG